MSIVSRIVALACISALVPAPALAYIGPGMGAGAIAVVLGLLSAVFFALVALLWYPIKRLIRGRGRRGVTARENKGGTER